MKIFFQSVCSYICLSPTYFFNPWTDFTETLNWSHAMLRLTYTKTIQKEQFDLECNVAVPEPSPSISSETHGCWTSVFEKFPHIVCPLAKYFMNYWTDF